MVTLKNVTLSERSIEDFVLHDSIHTNQPWIFAGRTDDEAEAPIPWHEFEQTPGAGEGQGSLKCCSPWDRKELDMTERLN